MTESIGSVTLQTEDGQEKLQIVTNWTQEQQQQIIELTKRDSQVCKLTDDPDRFADQETLTQWLASRDRSTYAVLDLENQVVGSVWVTLKQCENSAIPEEFGCTFAIRLYEKARGAGLAVPVLHIVITHFINGQMYKESQHPGFWLRIKMGNEPAYRTYSRFGFTTAVQDKQFIWMTWMPEIT